MSNESQPTPTESFLPHAPNILKQPDLETSFPSEEVTKLGDIPVVTANWGQYISAEDFKRRYREQGLLKPADEEMIDNIGFNGGWIDEETAPALLTEEGQERQALFGAKMAYRAIRERGWNHVDRLFFASVSSGRNTPKRIAQMLKAKGITVEDTRFYGMACAGGGVASGDAIRDKELQGKNVVIIAQDNLGSSEVDRQDIQTRVTFGNGGYSEAIIPGHEVVLHYGFRWVRKDTGQLKLPHRVYEIEDISDPIDPPPYYLFHDEEARRIFKYSKEGAFLEIPSEPGLKKAYMDGTGVSKYFFREVPSRAVDFLRHLWADKFDFSRLGVAVAHQPAKPVHIGTLRFLQNKLDELRKKEGINIPTLDVPWLMDRTKANNMSAPTSMFYFAQAIKDRLIEKGKLYLMLTYGVGSLTQLDVVEYI